ncbi:alpha/beta hydrolase [Shimwellia blattae]|uniref:Secretory lipase family protein n=1 Tax=Shimwellia blattae (strain ATCC 29907 / DSM 4481 / JCM 1650 / NBRC 105725 / CDC 9005-74) TaxID=630626 RepID=I2B9P0_SHIBC|nr:alpha/beta fold hydrolase [Shimwellia blattae]AFJ47244.1 secretory lipase family protein [Shimwellia blattae DSM 4481 = NBRC 105725]GAB82227.1 putative lipase [Shimwellia blattae DSM 4481 = NBRC 105725]VDY64736.1 Secretory lipase [Shimwellia blattae]VEC22836.1 Secretory lipase [Shimwellia blattae]
MKRAATQLYGLALGLGLGLTLLSGAATAGENGQLVTRKALSAADQLSEAAVQYRIGYRAGNGVAGKGMRTDSAAIFLPFGEAPKEGWPVVVWAHGTAGIASECAPSLNPRTARESQYLNTWLSLGFAVVAPDYQGLGSGGLHHYLNARAEAWSVLDSIRAALAHFPLQNKLILIGQSQGAHAAFAAAGYQPQYASDLNIVATVVTGTPYFNQPQALQALLDTRDQESPEGDPRIPPLFYLWQSAADHNHTINAADYFTGAALPLLAQSRQLCLRPLTGAVAKNKLTMSNTLKPAFREMLAAEEKVISFPTLKITHPVFIGIGGKDLTFPGAMQKQFARDVRQAGTSVSVHYYPELDSDSLVNPSLRDVVPFVLQQMAAGEKKSQ